MYPEGRIINEQDKIEEGIWCIGPMRSPVLWETTALRELREQASELASLIVENSEVVRLVSAYSGCMSIC